MNGPLGHLGRYFAQECVLEMQRQSSNPFSAAMERWHRGSVPLLQAASREQIESTFAQLGMPVSDDIRALYSSIGGFKDFASDNMWSLWSLARIRSENLDRDGHTIWLADWSISAHMYGIKYTNPESSAVFIDHNRAEDPPQQIACNMIEFLADYANDPDKVEAWIIE